MLFLLSACSSGKITLDDEPAGGSSTSTRTDDTAERVEDPQDPACEITSPASELSQPWDEPFTFAATASDPQDGDLDGAGIVWRTSADAVPLGDGASITVVLPASGAQNVSCNVVDSDGNTGTAEVRVTALSPLAEIWHPGDGETREAGADIPWVGAAEDREDGALPGDALEWSSDLDGTFGTGDRFSAPLSAGQHRITLTATDSDGNTGTTSISLTIE
ncbi:MAG: hypothetical protein ACOZNI_20950 [Myxococcota bacterium]